MTGRRFDLHDEAGPVGSAAVASGFGREFGAEGQARAASHVEGGGDLRARALGGDQLRRDLLCGAVGRVEHELGVVHDHVHLAQPQRDAVLELRQGVGGGRDGGGARVDRDRRAHHDVAEVVGAGDRGRDHRKAERRPLVGAGQVDGALERERRRAGAGGDRRGPNAARVGATRGRGHRVVAGRDARDHPEQPRRLLDRELVEVLFAVFAAERERELGEGAGCGRGGPRRARVERRVERPRRGAGSSGAVGIDAEFRFEFGRSARRAPRRQGRRGDRSATALRIGQHRSLATLELQLQQFERLLGLFFKPGFQLARFFIGVGRTVELDDHPCAGILGLQ